MKNKFLYGEGYRTNQSAGTHPALRFGYSATQHAFGMLAQCCHTQPLPFLKATGPEMMSAEKITEGRGNRSGGIYEKHTTSTKPELSVSHGMSPKLPLSHSFKNDRLQGKERQ